MRNIIITISLFILIKDSPSQTTFSPQQIIIEGSANYPSSLTSVDLDNDGDNDVIFASVWGGTVYWYENYGNGNFSYQKNISEIGIGAGPICPVDLDNDGDYDILSSSGDNIVWYKNLGDGSFASQQIITYLVDNPSSVYAADLDNDGDMDAISGSYTDNKVAWYENNGNGNFGPQNIISTSDDGVRCVHSDDLDNDGDFDIIVASFFNHITWYENDGTGNFGGQQSITYQASKAVSVYSADLDGDGDQDIISANQQNTNKIAWYENDGAGNFGEQKIISGLVNYPTRVISFDMDNDGDNDVLSSSAWDDKIAWYKNQGQGNFGEQQIISSTSDGASSVFASDLNNDGYLDVISSSTEDNKIAWYKNNNFGGFEPEEILSKSAEGASSVYSIDFDGDGLNDILSTSFWDDRVAWYKNLGNGTFNLQNIIDTYVDGATFAVAGDLDNDNDYDIVAAGNLCDRVVWYENDSLGNFIVGQIISSTANALHFVSIVDLDMDGDNDIICDKQIPGIQILWFENDGNGNFSNEQFIASDASITYCIYPVDFDGDNDKDILCGGSEIFWYEHIDGNGSFRTKQVIAEGSSGIYYEWAYPSDVDNDGDFDILTASSGNSGIIKWHENDGEGNFGVANTIYWNNHKINRVYSVDLDLDGDQDILYTTDDYENAQVAYLLNNGQGNFFDHTIITTSGEQFKSLYTSDLNNDGDLDLISASEHDNKIAWYENLLAVNIPERKSYDRLCNVFPNPTNDLVYVNLDEESIKQITICDLTGKLKLKKIHRNRIIDLSKLENGIYIFSIHTGTEIISTKILKQ